MKTLTLLLLLTTGTIISCFSQQTFYDVTPGNGNGLRFWQSDWYKIHMGNGAEYQYGPVSDYSIKMNMSTEAGRGWTWGIAGQTPIAALSTSGHMQIAGSFNAMGQISVGGVGVITSGGQDVYANVRVLRNTSSTNTDGMYIGYGGSGGPLRFFSNSGTTEHMTLATSGNLGIGTTAPYPSSRLHIKSPSANSWGIIAEATSNQRIIGVGHDGTAGNIAVSYLDGTGFSPLNFSTSNITRMAIATDGNVGIGTTTPRGKFDVDGTGDIYLSDDLNAGAAQSLYLPGHIYISPYNGTNISYLQARRYDNSGTTALRLRTYTNGALTEAMHIEGNGNVGIGTTTPAYKLDVSGPINASALNVNGQPIISSQWTTTGAAISYTGKVGIGTPLTSNPNNYSLAVNGTIGARDVRVEKSSTTWPDYVFEKGYNLPSLNELENYIQEHKHLEDVPSAKEVEEKGYSLNEMDVILLKKVEELSLYIIQQQKEIQDQKKGMEGQQKEIQDQKKGMEEQQKEIDALKKKIRGK